MYNYVKKICENMIDGLFVTLKAWFLNEAYM